MYIFDKEKILTNSAVIPIKYILCDVICIHMCLCKYMYVHIYMYSIVIKKRKMMKSRQRLSEECTNVVRLCMCICLYCGIQFSYKLT